MVHLEILDRAEPPLFWLSYRCRSWDGSRVSGWEHRLSGAAQGGVGGDYWAGAADEERQESIAKIAISARIAIIEHQALSLLAFSF